MTKDQRMLIDDNLVKVRRDCPFCGKGYDILADKTAYNAWKRGVLIQDVFPKAPASYREMLISGICEACQEVTFGI